jgi:hypothetical protein
VYMYTGTGAPRLQVSTHEFFFERLQKSTKELKKRTTGKRRPSVLDQVDG